MVSYLLCVTISSMKQLSIETAKDGSILLEQDCRAALDELSQLEQVGRDTAGTSKWQGRSVGRSAGREGGREVSTLVVVVRRPSSVVVRRLSPPSPLSLSLLRVRRFAVHRRRQSDLPSSVALTHSQSVTGLPTVTHSLTHSLTIVVS